MEKDLLDQLIEEGCVDAGRYWEGALELYNDELFERAILACNKAIELEPDFSRAFNRRGAAKAGLGQETSAIEDFNKAIEIDPNDAWPYVNRGIAKADLGQKTAAIEDYNKAIEIDPNNAKPYTNRGIIKADLGQKIAAIEDYNKAIQIDRNFAGAYHNRGNAKLDLGQMLEARQDFLRAQSLYDKRLIRKSLSRYLTNWATTFPAPYLIHQLLTEYPEAQKMTSLHTLAADNARQCRPLLLWQTWGEQRLDYCNLLWFNILVHLRMGDPITANRLLEELLQLSPNDLAAHYFYQQTATDILHNERETIQDKAVELAQSCASDDHHQCFYAGRILETLCEHFEEPNQESMLENALSLYEKAGNWWPAAVARANFDASESLDNFPFEKGLPVTLVQPEPEKWLEDLEQAVLFFDLEEAITMQIAPGAPFPRFWEIWNTDALVEPLRNWQAERREAWLRERFVTVFADRTADRLPYEERFEHDLDVKVYFDWLGKSEKLPADLALIIGKDRIPTDVCAALLEYFYLKQQLPAEEVFYLYFFLVQRRGVTPADAASAEWLSETGKGLLEDMLKTTVPLLAVLGDSAVAGAAAFLKTLFSELLATRPSLLGQPGALTPYEQFKAQFKNHVSSTIEVLGSREAFLKQYPIEGFGDLL